MDSYIVRVYRRDLNDSQNILGIVEMAGSGTQQPFRNRDELWNLLLEFPVSDVRDVEAETNQEHE